MLPKELIEKFVEQIQREAFASHSYLYMASWCENHNLPGIASYFYDASEDEREHMLSLYKYVNLNGGFAEVKTLAEPRKEFKSVLELFEHTLYLEQTVTKSINELSKECDKASEYAALYFLKEFVLEQEQSENSVNDLLVNIKRIGIEERNLYYLDKFFAKLMAAKNSK
ncbi:MAG: ferritin [Chitinophagaceae bacterium]|jgi:ferritin|nr:ferritin [Chitinophagaceae bacterium]